MILKGLITKIKLRNFSVFPLLARSLLIFTLRSKAPHADDALAARYAPTLTDPAGTFLVGIIAAAPYQRQNAFKGKDGFVCQKLQTMYRIDQLTNAHCTLTG